MTTTMKRMMKTMHQAQVLTITLIKALHSKSRAFLKDCSSSAVRLRDSMIKLRKLKFLQI